MFRVYGREDCGYTQNAIELLDRNKIPFEYDFPGPARIAELKVKYDHPTVPLVFMRSGSGYRFIGGYTELQRRLLRGKNLSPNPRR